VLQVGVCCLLPIAGCCYIYNHQVLVNEGEYGFTKNNGHFQILLPGRHYLLSPLQQIQNTHSQGADIITVGQYITIVRIQTGYFGFALENGKPLILLPGLHCYASATFVYFKTESQGMPQTLFGPIKMFTVNSGAARICYSGGKVSIFKEGRYIVNSGNFVLSKTIMTQQQTLKFEKTPFLLDGGISLLVQGLLTFRVVDLEQLIHQLGESDIHRSLQDVTRAELARCFSTVHLEEISSATSAGGETESKIRDFICKDVIQAVNALVQSWGVSIINFQLESTMLANPKYSQDYEKASLKMAVAVARRRAVDAENEIIILKAKARCEATKIEFEGKKAARVIEAQATAEARVIDAESRFNASVAMEDPFAKEFALGGVQVEFAGALSATDVRILPKGALSTPMGAEMTR
jgi:regulator of protease activity HflC (stomatin/prohibitin superfamily)